jgi:hypothetical protein
MNVYFSWSIQLNWQTKGVQNRDRRIIMVETTISMDLETGRLYLTVVTGIR